MLVDSQIRKHIKQKNIQIDPFDDKLIDPSSIHIRLGKDILIPRGDMIVDILNDVKPKYKARSLDENGFVIEPGQFILGESLETLTLKNNIGAFVDGRTTLARLGLTVHQTATLIFPGHTNSIITLEIKNGGNFRVKLYKGMQIGKVIFFQTSIEAEKGYKEVGRYAKQSSVRGPIIVKNDNHRS